MHDLIQNNYYLHVSRDDRTTIIQLIHIHKYITYSNSHGTCLNIQRKTRNYLKMANYRNYFSKSSDKDLTKILMNSKDANIEMVCIILINRSTCLDL